MFLAIFFGNTLSLTREAGPVKFAIGFHDSLEKPKIYTYSRGIVV